MARRFSDYSDLFFFLALLVYFSILVFLFIRREIKSLGNVHVARGYGLGLLSAGVLII
jgi:hypothetical protein